MDELVIRQLTRQLKIMNFWITVFGSMILAVLLILGILLFKVVSFVNDTNKKIESISQQTRESLDFKSKFCNSDSVGGFLADKTNVCKQ